jgi:hypothetical protein
MSCPACGGDRVAFAVPTSLQPYTPDPDESSAATLCTTCLRVEAVDVGVDDTDDGPVAVDWEPLPTGEAGVATALLLGLLDSLALRRADVTALVDHVEATGGDVFLTLDRLVTLSRTGEVEPHVDLERRTAQLQSLLD